MKKILLSLFLLVFITILSNSEETDAKTNAINEAIQIDFGILKVESI